MTKKIQFPHLDADAALVAARKPVDALSAKEADIAAIVARLEADTTPAEFAEAVDAVLRGADPVTAARALDNSAALESSRKSLALVEGAIARAKSIIELERVGAKRRLVEAATPTYRAIAAKFTASLIAIAEQQHAFLEFRDALKTAGLADWPYEQGPLGMAALGDVRDENSPAAKFIIAAVTTGVVGAGDIPKSLRDSWPLLAAVEGFAPRAIPHLAEREKILRLPREVGMPSSRLGQRAAG